MNLKGKIVSVIYALVLLGCAFFAGFDTFAFAFGIGDGGGQIGILAGTLLIGTLAGGCSLLPPLRRRNRYEKRCTDSIRIASLQR
jgi:hypothetical protein